MSNRDIELLKHQLEFVTDLDTRYLGLCSGYGGGKTYAFCMKAIFLASQNVGYRGALLEPTNVMVRDVLIPMMDQLLEENRIPFEYKSSPLPEYTLHFAHGSCKILLRSAENYKRLVGLNLAFFGVDEADTIEKDKAASMWRQLQSRIRAGKVYQGFVTSTPEGFSWMHQFFVKEAEGTNDRKLIKAKTSDNPHLPPEYIDSLKSNYPPNLIDAYLNGEFVLLNSNNVYSSFDRVENHTEKTLADFPNSIIHVGLDFNVGQMAATLGVIDKKTPYILGEIAKGKNTEDMIAKLKARFPNRTIYVYPDSSGKSEKSNSSQSDIALLEKAGLKCYYHSKNPPVVDRVNSVNAMFRNGNDERRFFINTNECRSTVECLEQQAYKDGKPDKTSGYDHMVDALGYFLYYHYPIAGKRAVGRIF